MEEEFTRMLLDFPPQIAWCTFDASLTGSMLKLLALFLKNRHHGGISGLAIINSSFTAHEMEPIIKFLHYSASLGSSNSFPPSMENDPATYSSSSSLSSSRDMYQRNQSSRIPQKMNQKMPISQALRWLDLHGNALGDNGYAQVIRALTATDCAIEALDLSSNGIGKGKETLEALVGIVAFSSEHPEGSGRVIGGLLGNNTRLKSLFLNSCQLTNDFASRLLYQLANGAMIGPNAIEGSKTRALKDKIFIPLQCLGLASNKLSSSSVERALVSCIAFNKCLLEIDFSDNKLSESCGGDIAIACGVNLSLQFLILHTGNELNNADVETIEKHLLRNRVSWRKSCITTQSNRESNDISIAASSSSKGNNPTLQNPSSQSTINQTSSANKQPVLVGNVSAAKSGDYRNDIAAALNDELQNESDSESQTNERNKALNQLSKREPYDSARFDYIIKLMKFVLSEYLIGLENPEKFENEESIAKSNANSVGDESQAKGAQSASSQPHIANIDSLYTLCIPSGRDCIEYINVLLFDGSTTNRAITTGSTSKVPVVHVHKSNSSIMNNSVSINPQQDMQSDQDFLKSLFDQQNRSAILLDSSSTSNQSNDASSLVSIDDISKNDDLADAGSIDPSEFFLNLFHHKPN